MHHDLQTENPESKLRNSINNQIRQIALSPIKLDKPIISGGFNEIYSTQFPQTESFHLPPLVASIRLESARDPEREKLIPEHVRKQAELEATHASELKTRKNGYSPFLHFELGSDEGKKYSEEGKTDFYFYLKGEEKIQKKNNESTDVLREILAQIILGLEYLHITLSIVHRDLKIENILVFLREVWINKEKDIKKTVAHVKIADPDTYQEVNKEGKLVWKEATPKGTPQNISKMVEKLMGMWTSEQEKYITSGNQEYHSLDQFREEYFCLGTLFKDILIHFKNIDDAIPLAKLMFKLIDQDPNNRPASFDEIKSCEFFGANPKIRKNFFDNVFEKFRELDSFNQKNSTFGLTLGAEQGDVFNFLEEMKPVQAAWEKLTNKYDLMKDILEEQFETKPEDILKTIQAAMSIVTSFGIAKETLSKAIKELEKNSSVYTNYQEPLEEIKAWVKNYGEPLKNQFLILIQTHSGKNLIPKSSTTLNTTPNTPSTPITPAKKGPPPVPQKFLKTSSTSENPQSTLDPQTSSPPATPEKKEIEGQSPKSKPLTPTTTSSTFSGSPIRLTGLGGPPRAMTKTPATSTFTPAPSSSSPTPAPGFRLLDVGNARAKLRPVGGTSTNNTTTENRK